MPAVGAERPAVAVANERALIIHSTAQFRDMTHTCRNCKRTFSSELQYELHRDTCSSEALVCRCCGSRFPERRATADGWHYACPNDDCEGAGLGEDLRSVREFSVAARAE